MKILFFLLAIFIFKTTQETVKDAASYSRYMVRNEIVGSFGTIYDIVWPYVFTEDFSESSLLDGNLIFIFPSVENTFINLLKNNLSSFEIKVNNCSIQNWDGFPYDPLACYRVVFIGESSIKYLVTNSTMNANIIHYLKSHPVLIDWLEYAPHFFYFVTFHIEKIYYIGGWGSIHYIGYIDPELYFNAQPVKPPML